MAVPVAPLGMQTLFFAENAHHGGGTCHHAGLLHRLHPLPLASQRDSYPEVGQGSPTTASA